MSANNLKCVHIISDTGAPMMTLERFGRKGDSMVVQGALMGSWSAEMYIEPEDVPTMIKLLLNGPVIGYILSLPIILLRRKKKTEDSQKIEQ